MHINDNSRVMANKINQVISKISCLPMTDSIVKDCVAQSQVVLNGSTDNILS